MDPMGVIVLYVFPLLGSDPNRFFCTSAHPHSGQGWAMMGPPHHDILQVRRCKKLICSRSLRLVWSYCLALRMGWNRWLTDTSCKLQAKKTGPRLIRRVITRPVLNESQLQHVFAGGHSDHREVSWPQNIKKSMLWTYLQCLTPLLIDYRLYQSYIYIYDSIRLYYI